jgi:RNA polymerase sigma factor for flagellar operon FliA
MTPTRSLPVTSAPPTSEDVAAFMPLVHKEVGRMLKRVPASVLRDDLVAAGSFGLFDALRKSPGRGPQFDWYARVRIRGALVDELRSQDWLTRRGRARATQARADGTAEATMVVRLDDLPDVQSEGLADASAPTALQLVERRADRATLERAIALLPAREADIVTSHYFRDAPFKTLAGRLGVSEPRISQLHAHAIGMLRTKLTAEHDAESAA